MRRMGMTRGVVDVFLPIVRGGYAGLYIEMKRSNGVPSHLSVSQKSLSLSRENKAIVPNGVRAGFQLES